MRKLNVHICELMMFILGKNIDVNYYDTVFLLLVTQNGSLNVLNVKVDIC